MKERERERVRKSRYNPSEKRFILVKTVLPAVTPRNLAGAVACAFFREFIHVRGGKEGAGGEEGRGAVSVAMEDVENWMFSATGVHSEISLVRSVPRKCTRTFQHGEYIRRSLE